MSFGTRLAAVLAERGRLCVGIDPHAWLLDAWGLSDDAAGVREFGLRVVEASADAVGVVKPQVAFFERHGSAGYAALEHVLAAARAAGLLVIADAKRGDVGTSVDAYAQAWLTPGSPLEADAMTVSAFQGVGSLDAPRQLALSAGKGLFVLAATSNPESIVVQQATTERGTSVAGGIVDDVQVWNRDEASAGPDGAAWGSVGVVLGATVDLGAYGIGASQLVGTPILAPGFGAQGAHVDELTTIYGAASGTVIVSASRSILQAGPTGIARAVRTQASEVAEALAP